MRSLIDPDREETQEEISGRIFYEFFQEDFIRDHFILVFRNFRGDVSSYL